MNRYLARGLLLLSILLGTARADDMELRFLPQPMLDTQDARLGDLLFVHGGDPASVRRLLAIPVSAPFAAAPAVLITKDQVLAHVAREAPELVGRLRWLGPESVDVQLPFKAFDGARWQSQARDRLRDWLSARYAGVQLAPLPVGSWPSIGAQDDVGLRAIAGPVASRMPVWVDVRDPQGGLRSFPIWFEVQASQTAYVAVRRIESLGLITADDLRAESVDATAYGDDAVTDAKQALGLKALDPIAAGSVVRSSQLRPALEVEAGDEVLMRISEGGLRIEAHAVALEAGRAGQMVRLRSSANGAMLMARVEGHDVVEVAP